MSVRHNNFAAKRPGARRADGRHKASQKQGLPTKIAEQLREEIARGVLSPGVHLGQSELAERFGASRVPIREALKLLTAEGIVHHDPNRGFFVANLSSDEAQQLYRMRHLLEPEILSTVEWPDNEKLAELRSLIEEMEQLLRQGKAAEWVAAHRRFYQMIFGLSPKRYIVEEVMRLLRLTDRYRSIAPLPAARSERPAAQDRNILHALASQERNLLQALASRDRKRLLAVFEEERTRVEQALLSNLRARGL